MSVYKITVSDSAETWELQADGGKTLLDALRGCRASVEAPCGGEGVCGRCLVTASGRCVSLGGEERTLDGEKILACRWRPAGDLKIICGRALEGRVRMDAPAIPAGGRGLGLAVDIGTTTVAAYLYDLETGLCIGAKGEMNAQRAYGADVISRIRRCSDDGGLGELGGMIRSQVRDMARGLCPDLRRIKYVAVAGNTVMEHIFAGLSPESIGVAPFTPLSLFGEEFPASLCLEDFAEDCRMYLCPAVAGYVGGDITAGIMSSGAGREGLDLFIDVGTNGEMALCSPKGAVCCATAAGPAFEGAEIECGSSAVDGAIDHVRRDMSFTVLGGGDAKSICGSGLIDAAAALLGAGVLDETGRLDGARYDLAPEVYISQNDIRKLQLAKAAIRAGIETLLELEGAERSDIKNVLIAGGFGAYMDAESACAIGLLPPEFASRAKHTGNSAGAGAALALTAAGRRELARVAEKCRYEELSASALFNEKYIDAMIFGEPEDDDD